MESGGVLEPQAELGTEAELQAEAVEPLTAPLEDLPEEALLAVIGAYSLTPAEQRSLAVLTHAPEEISTELAEGGLVVDAPVDLVIRGRKVVRRVLADWEEELRERVCPIRDTRRLRRGAMVAAVAAVLAELLSLAAGAIGAIAVFLARFCLDELCHGWPGERPAAAAT